MNRGRLKTLFRIAVSDRELPYYWDDEELDEYLDEAELEASRRAHFLVDSSSTVSRASVSAGEPEVRYDSRMLFVRRARLASSSVLLKIWPTRRLDDEVQGWENALPSTPMVLVPDWETGAFRLYPPPAADDELLMTVVREPIGGDASDDDELETPARYQRGLLQWMRFRAYSKPDSDRRDPDGAAQALALFEGEFGEKTRAVDEHWSREQYYEVGDFQ